MRTQRKDLEKQAYKIGSPQVGDAKIQWDFIINTDCHHCSHSGQKSIKGLLLVQDPVLVAGDLCHNELSFQRIISVAIVVGCNSDTHNNQDFFIPTVEFIRIDSSMKEKDKMQVGKQSICKGA